MFLNRGIIPWIVLVMNVKLIFLPSDCKVVLNTSIELYDCAVDLLFAIYYIMIRLLQLGNHHARLCS